MRSFLLEYIKRKECIKEDAEIDIHVNLWRMIPSKSAPSDANILLDFGFMINDIRNVDSIILYCPLLIERVEDLGNLLFQQSKLVEAIFNENCEIQSNVHPNRIKVIKKGDNFKSFNPLKKHRKIFSFKENNRVIDKNKFMIYRLDSSLIDYSNCQDYSRIEIKVENILSGNEQYIDSLNECYQYYFRVRIIPERGMYSNILKRENEKLQPFQDSSLRTTDIIDFRINDFRSIIDNLREEAFRLSTFNISSVHYLIMRNSTDEFVSSSDEYKSRILEREIWKDYVKLETNDVIAYHFKNNKSNIFSFTNLSRFKYPLNVTRRILTYIFFIITISVISSFIYDFLKNII